MGCNLCWSYLFAFVKQFNVGKYMVLKGNLEIVYLINLVVGCWLLVVGCWLLVVGCCWLLWVVSCWLLVVGCWLLVVGC